jgi:hypothetical protein
MPEANQHCLKHFLELRLHSSFIACTLLQMPMLLTSNNTRLGVESVARVNNREWLVHISCKNIFPYSFLLSLMLVHKN